MGFGAHFRKMPFSILAVIILFTFTACGESNFDGEIYDTRSIAIDDNSTSEDIDEEYELPVMTKVEKSIEEADVGAPIEEEPIEGDFDEVEEGEHLPMEVHYIDVGEADSALVICGDEAMLIDSGNPDQGSEIRLYLKQHGVEKLKYLLLTHSDRDHIGGAASIVSNMDIDNLFMCRYEKDNDVYLNLINEIEYKSMKWSTPEVGSEYDLGDAIITIVAPNREYDNPNDSSIAFVIRHGEDSFIFTGDAEVAAEEDIVNNGLDISADVYYVGHHGSSTSSTQPFLDKVSPKYAVISCAKENDYGHPHVETMNSLMAMGVQLFRTDAQGTIIVYSNGNDITFNVEPTDDWSIGNAEYAESASTQVKKAWAEATQAVKQESGEEAPEVTDVPEEQKEEITYVLNMNSMKFHKPGCDSVKEMKEKNRKDVTLSRDEVVELGYKPCKRCNP